MQHGVMASLARAFTGSWVFSKPGFGVTMVLLWLLLGSSQPGFAAHSVLRVSLVPMSAAGLKLEEAVGFFKGKGTSG